MHYAIACGHELTAKAAEEVLKSGGNALDAAIAAFVMSWVVEPCMSGPGGGGFAMVQHEGRTLALDFFTQTPKHKKPATEIRFPAVEVDFGGTTEIFHYGPGSVAIPGAVDGIFALHDLGARLPMRVLVEQAVETANSGHKLVPFQRLDMWLLRDILGSSQRGREVFFDAEANVKEVGANIVLPHLSDFLDYMSREGRDSFYRGEVGHKIVNAAGTNGGHLSRVDMLDYSTRIVNVRKTVYHGAEVYTPDHPSIGGRVLSAILHESEVNGYLPSAMKTVFGLRQQWFDPGWNIKEGGTSHLNVIDQGGSAVSLSMSLGEGSGCFVEGTDIHLNNMLGEAALLPEGWHSWTPDSRLMSMMTPTLVSVPEQARLLAMGSGGASRIPFALAQTIDSVIRLNGPISQAVSAPRIHWDGKEWQIEPGYVESSTAPLHPGNHWDHQSLYFGGVHTAARSDQHFEACGDDRRDGIAISINS